MFKIYTGEMLVSICNSRKLLYSLLGAESARSVFNFPDILCVVTFYSFQLISCRFELPLPEMIMKILSFPYTFMEGTSNVSNCLSLLANFSIS